jgi:hypothetical protein
MDELDRLFRRLVQNIRTQYPEFLTRPFEVAELYQSIVPYRHNRRELGLETNQDYEMTLMRLLSGERGYLVVEDAMREAMREELASPNPDTAAFRAWSTSHVALAPEIVRRIEQGASVAAGPAGAAPAASGAPAKSAAASAAATTAPVLAASAPSAPPPSAASAPSVAPSVAPAPAPRAPSAAPAPRGGRGGNGAGASAGTTSGARRAAREAPTFDGSRVGATAAGAEGTSGIGMGGRGASVDASPAPSVSSSQGPMATPQRMITVSASGSCRYCGGVLPEGRRITYCPHCGQNLTIQHCPACGTELEIGWKFCTTCGRSVGAQ